MGAKIFCNICGVHIQDVAIGKVGTITGEEICETCGKRIDTAFGAVEKVLGEFQVGLKSMSEQAKQQYSKFDAIYGRFAVDAEELHLKVKKELNALKDNIIKEGKF